MKRARLAGWLSSSTDDGSCDDLSEAICEEEGLVVCEVPVLCDEDFTSPLQRSGAVRDVFAEHVLGTISFLYSIDPGRVGLLDAATEVRQSPLRTAALVCSAWLGCAAATFEWERQRHLDEKRLLLDPYVHPLSSGVHLAPCSRAAIYDACAEDDERRDDGQWLDPPRFVRLPFKEGDVLILDAARLSEACDALRDESPTSVPLQRLSGEAAAVARALRARDDAAIREASAAPQHHNWTRRTVTPPDHVMRENLDRRRLLRCRVSRLSAIALPRRRSRTEWWRARGPGGRVVVEIGVERRFDRRFESSRNDDDDDDDEDEPLFELADARDAFELETPCAEDLRPAIDEPHCCFKALSTKKRGGIAYSLPLPLLEPGVIQRVVPACYRSPCLDWPSLQGRPLPLGSTFCSIRRHPHVLLGYAREFRSSRRVAIPPPPLVEDDDHHHHQQDVHHVVVEHDSRVRLPSRVCHVLYVRDAASGRSASGEAAFWGMADWNRGDLHVYDSPAPPLLGVGEPTFAPPSLAHLLLDCSSVVFDKSHEGPTVGTRDTFNTPKCPVCSKPVRLNQHATLPCGCARALYCSPAHMRAHRLEHDRCSMVKDLLHPSFSDEKRKHKLKRLVQMPNSFFMDVKCPGCFNITTVFSHAQTTVLCGSCSMMLCQPTGGKARLTEGCSFRKKLD
ncbi:hypothetical protein CTAYLR_002316 [Chrysophaeum taylorii]|uniref:40S ribosomal protein S27 n=1 Tax=Chrysophaeum taylorii TaxID=2483200 RepID=A0AAD7UPR8_9STRA|nr:hypothetical protein CTAYLR_002316 [Chrysophaeum taylorii]